MSGVIVNGVQYEKCNCCGEYVEFPKNLGTWMKDGRPYRDVCMRCTNNILFNGAAEFKDFILAPGWVETKIPEGERPDW